MKKNAIGVLAVGVACTILAGCGAGSRAAESYTATGPTPGAMTTKPTLRSPYNPVTNTGPRHSVPAPTLPAGAPRPPAARATGITTASGNGPWSDQVFGAGNEWYGVDPSDSSRWYGVFAGADVHSALGPGQGAIRIGSISADVNQSGYQDVGDFVAPTRCAALAITKVNGPLMYLTSRDGKQFVFNVRTLLFSS